jgi:hypothetical protein
VTAAEPVPVPDRILPFTRLLSLAVVPFLVVALVLLYVLPGRTEQLFAWTIAPPLTAMLLASAYAGGIWFFVQVLRAGRWHRVRYGFPAVLVFATLLGVATFLHWDRFHPGHISFITWVTLYVTTPVLAAVAIVLNQRAGAGAADEREVRIPLAVRLGLAAIGGASLLAGLALFLAPQALLPLWPWKLTPLTARVVGSILTLPGMVNLWLLADARWSAFRRIVQAQLASLVLMVGALAQAARDLAWDRPAAPLFVAGIAGSLVVYAAAYVWLERRRLRPPAAAPAPRRSPG